MHLHFLPPRKKFLYETLQDVQTYNYFLTHKTIATKCRTLSNREALHAVQVSYRGVGGGGAVQVSYRGVGGGGGGKLEGRLESLDWWTGLVD